MKPYFGRGWSWRMLFQQEENEESEEVNVSKERLILLVEDAEEDGFLFMQAVKRAGLGNPVRVVRDGREALGYLSGAFFYADRDRFPLPRILMLDLKLPLVGGWEVLTWVREHREFADLLTVVLTSSDNIA